MTTLNKLPQLEFDCVMPISEMELNGFYLDEGRWREQLEKIKVAQVKAADELQDLLSAGVAQASLFGRAEINLDSQAQVTDALVNLGVPVPETTRGWQLQPLAAEYPVVAKLLEYRGVAKSLTSFGENILEFIEPKTGRIHADFRQIGAPTGRFSCSNPNLQQIPHGQEYRRCFICTRRQKACHRRLFPDRTADPWPSFRTTRTLSRHLSRARISTHPPRRRFSA